MYLDKGGRFHPTQYLTFTNKNCPSGNALGVQN